MRDGRPRSPFWYASFKGADGRWKFKSTKALNRSDALDVARKWETAGLKARQGELIEEQARKVLNQMLEQVGESRISSVTVRVHFDQVLGTKDHSIAPSSLEKYRRVARDFLVSLGEKADKRIDLVSPSDIQRFLDAEVKGGRKATTVNQSLKIVRVFFTKARRLGLMPNSPADAVESYRAKGKERGTFSPEQLARLVGAADSEWKGMILLGRCCGMRIEDAASLTWANVNLETDLITYSPGKSRDNQVIKVPLASDLRDYLTSLPVPSNRAAPVFPRLHGTSVGARNGLSRQFLDLVRGIGIDPYDGDDQVREGAGKRTPVFVFTVSGTISFRPWRRRMFPRRSAVSFPGTRARAFTLNTPITNWSPFATPLRNCPESAMNPELLAKFQQESPIYIELFDKWQGKVPKPPIEEWIQHCERYAIRSLKECPSAMQYDPSFNAPSGEIARVASCAIAALASIAEQGCVVSVKAIAKDAVFLVEALEQIIKQSGERPDGGVLPILQEIAKPLPHWPVLFELHNRQGQNAWFEEVASKLKLGEESSVKPKTIEGRGNRILLRGAVNHLVLNVVRYVQVVRQEYLTTARFYRDMQSTPGCSVVAELFPQGASVDAFLARREPDFFKAESKEIFRAAAEMEELSDSNCRDWADKVVIPLTFLLYPDLEKQVGFRSTKLRTDYVFRADARKAIRKALKTIVGAMGTESRN